MTSEPMFISASQLSRKADVPIARVWRLIQSGKLTPDSKSPNLILFHRSKIEDLKTLAARH